MVSVPIRGLFNLTRRMNTNTIEQQIELVSVPIRGLFNLTPDLELAYIDEAGILFSSPSGDYLI